MQPLFLFTLLLTYIANFATVFGMRYTTPLGWGPASPTAPFKDKRLRISQEATVYGWPSTGGRFELPNPGTFELDILGIEDHIVDSNCSADYVKEDAFVHRLRMLGGIFYPYSSRSRRWRSRLGDEEDVFTWLGWPEDDAHRGGVWMLKLRQSELIFNEIGRIRLARNMEERCRAIEMCGGTFYSVPTDEHMVAMEKEPALNRSEAEESHKCLLEHRRRLAELDWGSQALIPPPLTNDMDTESTS